jgi:predicted dehydrogenase
MERKVEEVVLEEGSADPALLALLGAAEGDAGASGRGPSAAAADPADETAGEGNAAGLLAFFQERRLRLRHEMRPFPEANPLEDELRDFLGALGGAPLAGASGEDGLRALRLAFDVRARVRESLRRMGLPAGS